METTNILIVLFILLFVIFMIIRALVYDYANKKTRLVTEKGYEFVCYFLSKSTILDYYRNKEQWMSSKYESVYNELLLVKVKWYVKLSGADEISNLISFYRFADKLTKDYSPFFSLDHYFSFSEFENLKQGRKIGRIIDKVVNNNLKQWVQSEYEKAAIELKNASYPDNISKKNQFEIYKN